MNLPFFILATAALLAVISDRSAAAPGGGPASDDPLAARARSVLHQVLKTEQSWVKVHAAEALVEAGEAAGMRKLFLGELSGTSLPSHRIGVWRLLASTAHSPEERATWVAKIEQVFLDPTDPDRLRALESLCKLRCRLAGESLETVRALAAKTSLGPTQLPWWALQLAGDPEALRHIAAALASADPEVRKRAGFALRWLHVVDPAVQRALAVAADAEPDGTESYPFVLGAALTLEADPTRAAVWGARLEQALRTGSANAGFEACETLKHCLTPADRPGLADLLDRPEGDVRVGVAATILYLGQRGH